MQNYLKGVYVNGKESVVITLKFLINFRRRKGEIKMTAHRKIKGKRKGVLQIVESKKALIT